MFQITLNKSAYKLLKGRLGKFWCNSPATHADMRRLLCFDSPNIHEMCSPPYGFKLTKVGWDSQFRVRIYITSKGITLKFDMSIAEQHDGDFVLVPVFEDSCYIREGNPLFNELVNELARYVKIRN